MVPFWVNGIAPPLPLARRVYAAGQMVRRAIEALPGNTHVGIVASGAISGDIGGPHARPGGPGGPPDEAWVTFALDCMRDGRIDDLLNAGEIVDSQIAHILLYPRKIEESHGDFFPRKLRRAAEAYVSRSEPNGLPK